MTNNSPKSYFPIFLWSLKLGAISNLLFLVLTFRSPWMSAPPAVLLPARIIFLVSTYRCLFPVRYKDQIVFHDSPISSIFLTRFLATFAEIALIYQLSYVLRAANQAQIGWVETLSWIMVFQVIISQFFVWGSILSGNQMLFFYEEIGWAIIYFINTTLSLFLYANGGSGENFTSLIILNILFGIFYLPWQYFHLRSLSRSAMEQNQAFSRSPSQLLDGLRRSIQIKNPSQEPAAWGGLLGVVWMAAYWAAVIPVWVFIILSRF